MSPANIFIPNQSADVRQFEPGGGAANSESLAGKRGSFDTLVQHALARPAQDEDAQGSSTRQRPLESGRPKRKLRAGAVRNNVSDPAADSDSDQEDTTQPQDGSPTSGSLENSLLTAAAVAAFAQPTAPPQKQSLDASSAAPQLVVESMSGALSRAAGEVLPAPGGKPAQLTAAGVQDENSQENPDSTTTTTMPLTAIKDEGDPAPPHIPEQESSLHTKPAKHGAEIEPEAQSPAVGISSAQEVEQMKKAVKTDKNAELNQQSLPGDSSFDTANEKLLSDKKQTSAPIRLERTDATTLSPSSSSGPEPSVEAPKTTTSPVAIESPHNRLLEQTQELVSAQASRLRETGSDSLSVMLKPGDGTQISLELQIREGTVSAQASLHRGDFELLSRHWPALQQRLEAQGIQLSSLQRLDTGTSSHSHQPRHQSHSREQGSTEISRAGSMTEPPGKRTRNSHTHRGWETWA